MLQPLFRPHRFTHFRLEALAVGRHLLGSRLQVSAHLFHHVLGRDVLRVVDHGEEKLRQFLQHLGVEIGDRRLPGGVVARTPLFVTQYVVRGLDRLVAHLVATLAVGVRRLGELPPRTFDLRSRRRWRHTEDLVQRFVFHFAPFSATSARRTATRKARRGSRVSSKYS